MTNTELFEPGDTAMKQPLDYFDFGADAQPHLA
jgi:hypothetical protein